MACRLPSLFLALAMAASAVGAPLADFEEDAIVRTEGTVIHLIVRASGITAPLDVHVTYGFPQASRGAYQTLHLTPEFPLGSTWLAEPRDNVYSDGHNGTAELWYTDPNTGLEVSRTIPVRIEDDEPYPTVTIEDKRIIATSSNREHEIPLRLSNVASIPILVPLTTNDSTATAGVDYTLVETAYTFLPHQTVGSVLLRVHGDGLEEGAESFELIPEGGSAGWITLVDPQPKLSPATQNVLAGDTTILDLRFDEPLDHASVATILTTDSAVAAPATGTVEITAGDAGAEVPVLSLTPGDVAITADFTQSDGFPSATVMLHVYDSEIRFAADRLRLKPGAQARVEVAMTPAPPEILVLSVVSTRPAIATVDPAVTIDSTGTASVQLTAHANGTAVVDLFSPGGRPAASLIVEVGDVPFALDRVVPASGPGTGGTAVTISGQGFTAPCSVRFGSVEANGVTVAGETTIHAVSPAHVASAVDVTVTCGAFTQQLRSAFTYTRGRSRAVRH